MSSSGPFSQVQEQDEAATPDGKAPSPDSWQAVILLVSGACAHAALQPRHPPSSNLPCVQVANLKSSQDQLQAALVQTTGAYNHLLATVTTERAYWQALGSEVLRLQAELATALASQPAAQTHSPSVPIQVLSPLGLACMADCPQAGWAC